MAIKENSNILISIIISLIISGSWLLYHSILIAYKIDLLKEIKEWLGKRSILIPTLAMFILPIFTAYLTLNPISDIAKLSLPLITFVLGQYLGKKEKQNEIKNNQVEIFLILKRKFSIVHEKICQNKYIIEHELDIINSEERGFVERRMQSLDKITEDFSRLDSFFVLSKERLLSINDIFNLRKMSIIIDEFNELIEDRRDYKVKCRELTGNLADQYFDLLKYTDKELIKLAECFEKLIDKVPEIEMKF